MRMDKFEELQRSAAAPAEPRGPEAEIFVSFFGLAAHGITWGRSHVYRMIKRGLFPAPVRLSANRIAWRLSELAAWKASRVTATYAPERPRRDRR